MDCEYGDSRNGKLVWQVGKDCVLDEEDEGAEGRVLVEVRQPSQVEGESFPQPQACELRTHIALPRQKGGICPRGLPDQQPSSSTNAANIRSSPSSVGTPASTSFEANSSLRVAMYDPRVGLSSTVLQRSSRAVRVAI